MKNIHKTSIIFAASLYAACPGVFQYQQSSSGEWYGKISLPNPYPILAIDINVEIYVTGDVPMVSHLRSFILFRNIINYFLNINVILIW
jgi:hypothetical protein